MKIPIRVMLLDEFPNSVTYRFGCDCTDRDHDVHIDFEFDKSPPVIWVTFYKKLQYAHWWGIGYDHWWLWFKRMWRRLRGVFILLFYGTIELEDEMIIGSEEHINSLIWILEKGKDYINEQRRIPR